MLLTIIMKRIEKANKLASMKDKTVKQGYNKIAKIYHKQRRIYDNRNLLKKFIKHMSKKSKILDLGS